MPILDDSSIMPTHCVEITKADGKVVREPAVPKAMAQARADALKARPMAGQKSVRVVPAKG